MDDHPLLNILANWPGRVSTQLAFEARGFGVHRAWQNRMIEFCGEHQGDLLNRYWDELALEWMRCAGKVISETRTFVIEPKYRSAFLDELFAARDFAEPPFVVVPLIRCLFEHLKRTWPNGDFAKNEAAFIREQRKQERERLGIQALGSIEKKRDVLPVIDKFGPPLGFERRRNSWHKNLNCGLVFEVTTDLGGSRYRTQIPLIFRIFHKNDPKFVFLMGGNEPFDLLVFGSRLYSGWDSSDFLLGVRAYIELFDVIAASFEASR